MKFEEFKIKHSEVIGYFQYVEHDLKWIYAYMKKGDPKANHEELLRTNLGTMILDLEALDNSDGHPYISNDDYKFLKQIKNKRNYWCHQAYVDFSYEKDFLSSDAYLKICNKLSYDHEKMSYIYRNVQNVRLQVVKRFQR